MRFVDHFVHHLFPHRHNNHKAHALQSPVLFFYLLLFVFVQFISPFVLQTKGNVLGYAINIEEQKLLEYTNAERLKNGLQALSLNQKLTTAAREKAKYMFSHNFWAHNAPDGTTPWKFISDAKYDYLFAGENLAKNFDDSKNVVDAWMASPSHRANIMQEKYTEIGFAVVNGSLEGEDTTLVVQMFGTPASASAPESSPEISEKQIDGIPAQKVMSASVNSQALNLSKFVFTKDFSLIFVAFLIVLLAIDTVFIWHKKIIRVSSHSSAHLLMLVFVFAIVFILKSGRII